ncbi:MAG: DUF2080 family transposase-associated protein [Candidatus Methanoperedens sp.]|nr:DUF2080 family transposase-associated protein [Candidatus Methanoperedens sp.]
MNKGKGEFKHYGYEVLIKTAKKQGKKSTSCNVYVPSDWEGKKVVVIRVE